MCICILDIAEKQTFKLNGESMWHILGFRPAVTTVIRIVLSESLSNKTDLELPSLVLVELWLAEPLSMAVELNFPKV